MHVVGIGGGIGAARLWTALATAADDLELTFVVNTADDLWLHGLRICPDLDTVTYALSGRQDTARGWGVDGESWRAHEALNALGGDAWFALGDVDLATHLYRTAALRRGEPLSVVTAALSKALGVTATVLPATDDEVYTQVVTAQYGPIHYEEYLVRHAAAATVEAVRHVGLDTASAAPGVLTAIAGADLVVIGPSNPVASVAPVLGVHGIRKAVAESSARVVVVSPIVSARPAGPGEARRAASRSALLRAQGVRPDPAGVAALYGDLQPVFVLDQSDQDQQPAVARTGAAVVLAPTLLHEGDPPNRLVEAVLGPARHHTKWLPP